MGCHGDVLYNTIIQLIFSQAAINKKDTKRALDAITITTASLATYRKLAKIDKE
jgi:hypothetical protein